MLFCYRHMRAPPWGATWLNFMKMQNSNSMNVCFYVHTDITLTGTLVPACGVVGSLDVYVWLEPYMGMNSRNDSGCINQNIYKNPPYGFSCKNRFPLPCLQPPLSPVEYTFTIKDNSTNSAFFHSHEEFIFSFLAEKKHNIVLVSCLGVVRLILFACN